MSDIIDLAQYAQKRDNPGPESTIANALEKLWLAAADDLDESELSWFAQLSVGAEHRLSEQSQVIRNYTEQIAKSREPLNPEAVSSVLSSFSRCLDDTKIMLAIANDAREILED